MACGAARGELVDAGLHRLRHEAWRAGCRVRADVDRTVLLRFDVDVVQARRPLDRVAQHRRRHSRPEASRANGGRRSRATTCPSAPRSPGRRDRDEPARGALRRVHRDRPVAAPTVRAEGARPPAAVSPSAIWRASAKRCSTASHTSSTEQAQIESWAELRITSQPRLVEQRRRPRSGGSNSALSGSASRSSAALGDRARRCARRRGSTPRPSGGWRRAPERSSPLPRRQPVGAARPRGTRRASVTSMS